ncbi:MAG: endopeptidase La [Leptolyngbyaceae cyanobacterium MO_188.B28]|nr:endopeptidase La [Leptolyngbyaceae cyanobacterium MO_188.B28]
MISPEVVDTTQQAQPEIPKNLPILPIQEAVIYPFMRLSSLVVGGKHWVKMVDDALLGKKVIALFWYDSEQDREIDLLSLGRTGTAAQVIKMLRLPEGSLQLLVQGLARVQIQRVTQTQPYPLAEVQVCYDRAKPSVELEGMVRSALGLLQEVVSMAPYLPNELAAMATRVTEPGTLADCIAATLNLKLEEQQQILDKLDVAERLQQVITILNREKEILEVGRKAQQEMAAAQREYILRQQMDAIRRELGEGDEQEAEITELQQQLDAAELPEEAQEEAKRELGRLAQMSPAAAEYTMVRTYLDWLLSLPWSVSTEDKLDLPKARQVLDQDHYDLDKVKQRILEYLAVRKLRPEAKGPILCFVGPPGVGKTSLGQSIARTLGRNFVRISLGGMRDEAEIRGHRRTYIGALPGRIIQQLRRAKSNNPVFMLDEVDKLMVGFQGDPAAALLEVLDPEQNHTFMDHYLDVAFDLRKVMFICTANVIDTIPPALLDRMELLELPGYTEEEKLRIAQRYLIPRQLKEAGLNEAQLTLDEEVIRRLIREYTREAGVRNVERWIGSVCRKIACQVASGEVGPFKVTAEQLEELLEPPLFRSETPLGKDECGVATGLAWTVAGGDILLIEAALMPGKGTLTLTGHLGQVMQESAKAALTYARSRAVDLGLPKDFHQKYDLHIHVPAGAIPKDGPSAGITIAAALISALTKRPIYKRVAMTGEITLRGRVLPVGGIKEKILAAQRAGVHTVILPKDNQRDLREAPESAKEQLHFVFVENMDDVLPHVLHHIEARNAVAV